MAHPEEHIVPDPPESPIAVAEANEQALVSFQTVLKHGREIQKDHHLVWFARKPHSCSSLTIGSLCKVS